MFQDEEDLKDDRQWQELKASQKCDVDPVSQEEIPETRLIRFKLTVGKDTAKMRCFDALELKKLAYVQGREGKPLIDPLTRIPFTDSQKRRIASFELQGENITEFDEFKAEYERAVAARLQQQRRELIQAQQQFVAEGIAPQVVAAARAMPRGVPDIAAANAAAAAVVDQNEWLRQMQDVKLNERGPQNAEIARELLQAQVAREARIARQRALALARRLSPSVLQSHLADIDLHRDDIEHLITNYPGGLTNIHISMIQYALQLPQFAQRPNIAQIKQWLKRRVLQHARYAKAADVESMSQHLRMYDVRGAMEVLTRRGAILTGQQAASLAADIPANAIVASRQEIANLIYRSSALAIQDW